MPNLQHLNLIAQIDEFQQISDPQAVWGFLEALRARLTLYIEVREWKDSNGSTYYSARVNGKIVEGYAPGYNGHGVEKTIHALGFVTEYETGDYRAFSAAGHTYKVIKVDRKKDLA